MSEVQPSDGVAEARRARLAGIAEVARALVGQDFGFVATSDGTLHMAVPPPVAGGGPVVDLLRVRELVRLLERSDLDMVAVEDTAAEPGWTSLAQAGPGPPVGSFSVARLRAPGGDPLGLLGGGGVAPAAAAGGVAQALEGLAALAAQVLAGGPGVPVDTERNGPERDRTVLESLRDGVLMFDGNGRVLTCNSAVERLFDVSTDWLRGRAHEEIIAAIEAAGGGMFDEDGAPFPIERHPLTVSRNTGATVSNVVIGVRRSRSRPPDWFQVSARALVRQHQGPPYPVVVSFTDVTHIRVAEVERDELLATIARERMFLGAVLGRVGEAIEACDASGRVLVFNEAMGLFLQPAPGDDPLGASPSVVGLARPDGRPLAPREHPLLLALGGARVSNVELVVTTPNGTSRQVLADGHQLRTPTGEKLGAVVVFHDVTEQKRVQSELSELALHDPLTGLANRILLSDRLEVAFERGVREDTGVGVLLLDLDDFKSINDRYGHATGDGVLVAVAGRLRGAVRPGDTVARLGGDEFVVVCPLAGAEAELLRVRDRLVEVLSPPVVVSGVEVRIAASIGMVVSGPGKGDRDSLLRMADESMYRVKEERRRYSSGTGTG